MATAKKTTAPVKKTTASAKKAAEPAKTAAAKKTAAPAAPKPVKDPFNKTTLVAHLASQAGVEPKTAKAVLAALETAILGAVHKKGCGEFTLPGLLKIGLLQVPAEDVRAYPAAAATSTAAANRGKPCSIGRTTRGGYDEGDP